jgi:hypothetical protein
VLLVLLGSLVRKLRADPLFSPGQSVGTYPEKAQGEFSLNQLQSELYVRDGVGKEMKCIVEQLTPSVPGAALLIGRQQ